MRVIEKRRCGMKLKFSLKDKEASLDADVEGLIEKKMSYKDKHSDKKTRYQIKQEEKRKTEELKHKQQMQWMFIMLGLFAALILFGVIATIFGI
jgi:hypothetical protein